MTKQKLDIGAGLYCKDCKINGRLYVSPDELKYVAKVLEKQGIKGLRRVGIGISCGEHAVSFDKDDTNLDEPHQALINDSFKKED